jgi:hypothetical protein
MALASTGMYVAMVLRLASAASPTVVVVLPVKRVASSSFIFFLTVNYVISTPVWSGVQNDGLQWLVERVE